MFWTAVWFVVNTMFVASAILYLFMHRAYTEARFQGADAERLQRHDRRRKWAGVCAIALFIAMAASFVINMRING